MSIEKTFTDFIVLHEKKHISNDIRSLEKDITSTTDKTISLLGEGVEKDIHEASKKLLEGMTLIKKVLVKHRLYDI